VTSAIQGRVHLCVFAEVSASWGRGCKGHRILRRVPDGGRHLGSSRAAALHGAVITVVWRLFRGCALSEVRNPGGEATGMSEARSHQRGGNNTPTTRSMVDPPKRFGCRETSVPLVKPRGAQTPRSAHAVKAATGSQKRTRYGYTSRRLGGRYRSDASRVSVCGESQDELGNRGASQKESRSAA